MGLRGVFWALGLAIVFLAALLASQRPFRVYPSIEPYDDVPLPPDWQNKSEMVFARLMYPPHPFIGLFTAPRRRHSFDWTEGNSSWTEDYPRADRHFLQALRRLTRVDTRSVEQPVNLDDGDDVFNYPFLYVAMPGSWDLTPAQVEKLREYLLRGGFLMADDFWGTEECANFESGIEKVLPGRPIVELPDAEPIFHTVYDLDDRYQIPGEWATRFGRSYRSDGTVAHWRGIYDDKGRLLVAICLNSDTGDSWEFADEPSYPEKYSALGIRLGVNFVIYAMTH